MMVLYVTILRLIGYKSWNSWAGEVKAERDWFAHCANWLEVKGCWGYVKSIVFKNMVMENVWNPSLSTKTTAILLHPARNRRLSSWIAAEMYLVSLKDVKLTVKGGGGDEKSTCRNAKWKKSRTVILQPCAFSN